MSKQIERILICLLWLLAVTLGACFWLNTIFGFNIFSAQHWQYLAYLQASQTPIRGGFYASIGSLAFISVAGLYILMRPRAALLRLRQRRRATLPPAQTAETTPPQNNTNSDATTDPVSPTAPTNSVMASPMAPMRPRAPINAIRTPQTFTAPQPETSKYQSTASAMKSSDIDDMRKIFTDAGYVVKPNPQIGNFKPALLAIGTDEKLWIGAIGLDQAPVLNATERLAGIFSDTLDDIEININAFIVAPSGPVSATDIIAFDNMDQLREYINNNKNTPPKDTDGGQENFDAYSEYIDTVITYMDKT